MAIAFVDCSVRHGGMMTLIVVKIGKRLMQNRGLFLSIIVVLKLTRIFWAYIRMDPAENEPFIFQLHASPHSSSGSIHPT
jgi:hypothetical protein